MHAIKFILIVEFVKNTWLFQKFVIILHKVWKYNAQNLMGVEENREEDVTMNGISEMFLYEQYRI